MNLSVPENIRVVMDILNKNGFKPYLVGGCVRDTVMGRVPHDYDITVYGTPEKISACFESLGYRTIPKGREFGTVGILSNGEVVEVTPYRTEGDYSDSRHPDTVEFVPDIKLDLSRRDFTVNAMAMDANGEILDLFGGRQDLEKGIIRCVGNPYERFCEDALRILRAVRFAARFGFEIEKDTLRAMHECAPRLSNISGERICSELRETLCSEHSYRVLSKCCEVIQHIIPCFMPHKKLCDKYGDFAYRLFICILEGKKRAIEDIHSLLKLSNSDYERLTRLENIYNELLQGENKKISFDNKVKKLLCTTPERAVIDIFNLSDSDTAELYDFLEKGVYRNEALSVKGGDIVKMERFPIRDTAQVHLALLKKVAVGEIKNNPAALMEFLAKCNIDFYKGE